MPIKQIGTMTSSISKFFQNFPYRLGCQQTWEKTPADSIKYHPMSSALYVLFHIGYGMNLTEMVFLFFIGLLFCSLFMVTRNIFILWPFFQPMGQLITVVKEGLELPMIATLRFVELLILFLVFTWVLFRKEKKMKPANP